ADLARTALQTAANVGSISPQCRVTFKLYKLARSIYAAIWRLLSREQVALRSCHGVIICTWKLKRRRNSNVTWARDTAILVADHVGFRELTITASSCKDLRAG